mmetsp:Transcript_41305/g.95349  ORF Transcript_41305/g.95349 Transcript_41305/m.95349 type:complete len:324 (-) Transcript_41305:152-1123(-)
MAFSTEIHAAARAYAEGHGATGSNKRDAECQSLIRAVMATQTVKDEAKAWKSVKGLVTVYRGIIAPECTNKKFTAKKRGAPSAASKEENKKKAMKWNPIKNPINSPIYNPINAARIKQELRAQGDAYLREHGEAVLSPRERAVALNNIELNPEAFMVQSELEFVGPYDQWLVGKSLRDLLNHPRVCIYIGETGQFLKAECFRWVGGRDASMGGGGGANPTLRWPNGDIIKQSEMIADLGFRSVVIYTHMSKPETTFVEDALQQSIHGRGLPRRLHRVVGAGSNGYEKRFGSEDPCKGQVHKVFVTYSYTLLDHIASGAVKVMS